jgi:2-octaprenylphenol hydroxylase
MSRIAAGRDFDIVVAGAGVTASAMAGVLVARGVAAPGRVAVVADRHPSSAAPPLAETDWDLRVFALSRASQRLLMACGAWQHLPPGKRYAYERMCVWEAQGAQPVGAYPRGVQSRGAERRGVPTRDGQTPGVPTRGVPTQRTGSLCFDCAELGEPNLGFIVEGRALQAQCRRAASTAGVVFVEAGIAGLDVEESRVRLRLNDGRGLECGLLIAADGVDSPTRSLLGIDTAGHAYDQDALVAHVRTEKPHRRTAWQRFLPTGPLAFLPLPDGRSSIVWSATGAEARRLRSLDAAAFGAALTAASGEFLGACELTTPLVHFPLKLQYAVDYVRPRAALVGDAAHVVHPLAGQGLNLGLLDCATLAEVLRESSRGAGGAADARVLGELKALRRYERRRRPENLLAAAAMDGLQRLYASDNRAVRALRGAALSAVARMPFLTREFALRALGLRGDIPAFLMADPELPAERL